MNVVAIAVGAVTAGIVLLAWRRARSARAWRRAQFAPAPSATGFAPAEWLYAQTSPSSTYTSLGAAQAACAANAGCVGVSVPLTTEYLIGTAPASAAVLTSLPTVGATGNAGNAGNAGPIAFYARVAATAAAAPYTAQDDFVAVSTSDPLTCAGSSVHAACVLPSRGIGERVCDSLPACLGYVRAIAPSAADVPTGAVQLYSIPLVPAKQMTTNFTKMTAPL